METTTATAMKKEHSSWLKRIGFVGFTFFLIKGLFWLAAMWAGFSFF